MFYSRHNPIKFCLTFGVQVTLPGEKLGELLLVHDDLLPVLVEDDGLGTAGTLVEG